MHSPNGNNSHICRVGFILGDFLNFLLCAFPRFINSLMRACVSFTKINSFKKCYQVECIPNPELRHTNNPFLPSTVVIRDYLLQGELDNNENIFSSSQK